MCRDACLAAKRLGVKVSCDLNYRQNLWTPKQAQAVMKQLMKYVDVLIANEEDSDKMLGISPAGTDVHSGKLSLEGYQDLARTLCQTFGFSLVANTLRESISASVNHWSALLYDGDKHYFSKKYTIHLVDRVGGGDSFASGLIYALLKEMSLQDSLEFAVAASCLKQTIEQDFNLSTVDEVKTLMAGDGSGRVVR
jgi:2-dehydro-3-deoxygluconokinase